ncbi:helix-turn-helix transcriptional regulator [Acinetobacter sp. AYS6]|uniref:winged helix-turn-helix transcriptional regulator n=1 Tax=Acinetobacter sp. AYS6 TaxID=2983297 RepID=UPI0021D681B3|nr:helix-turn-helix domain-containing protein [Acinetobacter sp. AYS6]MCU7695882.1 helix-turn-helix transcriptional regulator [Acinetobacter sp. AYS6]
MKWDDIGDQPCSVARMLSVIGDRWTMLILRNAFMGIRRFDDFQKSLGVTRHVLSDRLKRLVEYEILAKTPYFDRQERFEYRLTDKGFELYPIILSMANWADKWMDQGLGKPLEYRHKTCGHKFEPVMVCSVCHEPLHAKQVQVSAGPGYFAYIEQKQKQA